MKKYVLKVLSALIAAMLFGSCEIKQTEAAYKNAFPVFKEEETAVLTSASSAEPAVQATTVTTTEVTTAPTETTTAVPSDTAAAPVTTEPAFMEADTTRFSEKLSEIYDAYGVTGMSVAVFGGGEIIYTENLGFADVENEILCDDNTRYRIASPSKLISTILLMKLCEEGKLSLDTPLAEATGIGYDWEYCSEKVRLWHLLTHTAGLYDTWVFENETSMRHDINRIVLKSRSGHEPGTVFSYSNFGSGSIGAVIERITGEYFHNYADKVLFSPLGMDAGYVIDLIDDKESCAKIYDLDGEIFNVSEWGRTSEYYEAFGLGNSYYSAQCELIITASDLARFGIALSGDGSFDGKRVLSEESVNAINNNYISAPNFDMGLNVRIYDDLVDGRIIYGHPGNALGCVTGLYYDPSDGTGIAFLTNRCLPYTEENGVYSAIYDAVTEAYDCFFKNKT